MIKPCNKNGQIISKKIKVLTTFSTEHAKKRIQPTNLILMVTCYYTRNQQCQFVLSMLKVASISIQNTEAVARKYSVKEVFLEILQNSQENTCFRVSFSVTGLSIALFYRIPLAPADSENAQINKSDKSKNNDLKMSYYLNG